MTNSTGGTSVPWPTPRRLRAFILLIGLGALMLFAVGETTLSNARHAVRVIRVEAAPSIISALEIRALMADLDANAANYLLDAPTHSAEAMRIFEEERTVATTRIIEAAQNITYGDSEKVPIIRISHAMGRYLEMFGEAKYRHDVGDQAGALATYRAATDLMHKTLMPAAEALDDANKSVMRDVYDSQRRSSNGAEALAAASGALLMAALLWAQGFLFRRTRRVFNVALVAASVLTLVFTSYLVSRFNTARADLKIAKEDAFESIHTLSKIRAYAFDANGDESRYLLDRDRERANLGQFDTNLAIITSAPEFPAALQREVEHLAPGQTWSARGLLADEMNNITFAGEREAAIAMAQELARYYKIDGRIRALARDHTEAKRREAILLCLGDSNVAFERFDRATRDVIDLNRAVFDDVLAQADRGLKLAEILDPAFAALIALLSFFGIRARLREYA